MSNFSSIVKQKVISALTDYSMLDFSDKIVVGFSGGADSVCLLHILNSLKKEYGFILTAAHVNHGLRGDEAVRDADFSRNFCDANGIPFSLLNVDCYAEAEQSGESIEECGRRIRYSFFNSLCDDYTKIATAHNANDNAETVVFNIIRGTSLNGACGIPPVRGNIIRPLLYCSRQEIEGYCEENELSFVTDSSNLSDDYSRNKIRHLVLPVLEGINSGAVNNINSFSLSVRNANTFICNKANVILLNSQISPNSYRTDLLLEQEDVICKQCIVLAFSKFSDKVLDSKKIDNVLKLLKNGGRLQLFGSLHVEVVKGVLRFFSISDSEVFDKIFIDDIPFNYNNSYFSVEIGKFEKTSKKINKLVLDKLIDCDKISGKICLRTRKAGDDITLPRRGVTKSLKKLYSEMNIPVELRNHLPVLADDKGVVWVFSVGVCERCKVDDDSVNIVYVRGENNE